MEVREGVWLVRPDVRYRESFVAAAREYRPEGRYTERTPEEYAADFPAYVRQLLGYEDRANLPAHFVPETLFWLVAGDEFIGRASLRHELNAALLLIGGHIGYDIRPSRRRQGFGTALLGLVLPHARARGLARVLLTCDADNYPSRRIIERHGGVPDIPYAPPGGRVAVLRYWIELGDRRTAPYIPHPGGLQRGGNRRA